MILVTGGKTDGRRGAKNPTAAVVGWDNGIEGERRELEALRVGGDGPKR